MAKKNTAPDLDVTPFTVATIQKHGQKYLCVSAVVSGHQIQAGEAFGECGGKAFAIAEYKRYAALNLFTAPKVAVKEFESQPDPASEFPVVKSLGLVQVEPERTTTVMVTSQGDKVIGIKYMGETKGRAYALVEFKRSSQLQIFNAF